MRYNIHVRTSNLINNLGKVPHIGYSVLSRSQPWCHIFAKSNFQFISVDATSPVIVIVFCLIIVRVELGMSQGTSPKTFTTDSDGLPRPFFRRGGYASHKSDGIAEGLTGHAYSLQACPLPITVQITQGVNVDNQSGCLIVEGDTNISLDKDTPNLGS